LREQQLREISFERIQFDDFCSLIAVPYLHNSFYDCPLPLDNRCDSDFYTFTRFGLKPNTNHEFEIGASFNIYQALFLFAHPHFWQ